MCGWKILESVWPGFFAEVVHGVGWVGRYFCVARARRTCSAADRTQIVIDSEGETLLVFIVFSSAYPPRFFFFLRSLSTRRVARVVLYLVGSFHEFFSLFPLAKRYQYVLLFFLLSLCDYYAMCLIAERCQYVLLLFLSCHSLRLLSHLFENLDQASVTPFLQKRSVVIWPVSFLDAMLCLRFISILYALSY